MINAALCSAPNLFVASLSLFVASPSELKLLDSRDEIHEKGCNEACMTRLYDSLLTNFLILRRQLLFNSVMASTRLAQFFLVHER